jgi:hypothetical protein
MRVPTARLWRRLGAGGAALSVTLLVAGGAPAAQGADAHPCFARHGRWYCPLWTGWVPVRESARPDAARVGWLIHGGSSNWFIRQCMGQEDSLGAWRNYWWALTDADNGRRGFVNEIYFAGGGADEPDGGWLAPPGGGLPRVWDTGCDQLPR